MGLFLTKIEKIFYSFSSNSKKKILIVGLDFAGKTTILYKLKLGEVVSPIPIIGMNLESVVYKNVSIISWDLCRYYDRGRMEKILLKTFRENSDALIFVFDVSDVDRLDEAKETLQLLLKEKEFKGIPFLILANKIDLNSEKSDEIIKQMKVDELDGHECFIQKTNAVTNEGILEGFDWLGKVLNKK